MAREKETKEKKKKLKGPDDIEGFSDMNPMQKMRALALLNEVDEGKVIPASDFDANLRFLEVPDICYQWALGRPGYAMGRIEVLMGYEGSSKTSKQLWLANLAFQQGGLAAAVYVEHADSTFHMQQYVRPEFMPYFMCYPCDTLEEAIRRSYEIQDKFAQLDPEGLVPKVQIFDSIAGATQEKLLDEEYEPGAPKPGGIGGIMSDFVNAMQTRISRTNTLWAVNNQAKDGIPIGHVGPPIAEIDKMVGKGGRALPFHATYHEIVKKTGTIKVESDMMDSGKIAEGFESRLTFKKNKLGIPLREVFYDVVWHKGFDFTRHTMEFLAVTKTCGMMSRAGGNKGKLYYSKDLGVTEKNAIPMREMYALVHSPEHLPKFQRELEVITEIADTSGREAVPRMAAELPPPAPPE
jgi:RecA/RadA recombinase